MNTTTNASTVSSRPRQFLAEVRDELRERRGARAERRTLERELSVYSTRAEVDDLLASIEGEDTADADQIRSILTGNLNGRLAS